MTKKPKCQDAPKPRTAKSKTKQEPNGKVPKDKAEVVISFGGELCNLTVERMEIQGMLQYRLRIEDFSSSGLQDRSGFDVDGRTKWHPSLEQALDSDWIWRVLSLIKVAPDVKEEYERYLGETFRKKVEKLCSFIPYFESEGATTKSPEFSEFCLARAYLSRETIKLRDDVGDLFEVDYAIGGNAEEISIIESANYIWVLLALHWIQRAAAWGAVNYSIQTRCIKNGIYLAILRRLNALLIAGQIP
jgi:hypothetical protein